MSLCVNVYRIPSQGIELKEGAVLWPHLHSQLLCCLCSVVIVAVASSAQCGIGVNARSERLDPLVKL